MSIPAVFSIDPSNGPPDGGTFATITGESFVDVTGVTFGGLDVASLSIDSETQISVETPSGLSEGDVDVIVTTVEGSSEPVSFSVVVTPIPGPAIDTAEPSTLDPDGGTTVTITGQRLGGTTAVSFGGSDAASFSVDSDTQLSAESPVLSLEGDIELVVTTPSGSASMTVTAAAGCTVTAFNVPTGRSGCTSAGNKRGEQFRMEADFSGSCRCCEYRQFVRGTFTANGRTVRHLLPDPAGGPPRPMLPRPSPGSPDDNFREDGVAAPPAGINKFYGHRSEGSTDPNDQYLPDRPAGCRYRGSDFPGLAGAAGTTYSIELDFRGQIVDACAADSVKNSNTWTVSCSGVI